jgi:hypothetical protein
VNPVLGKNNNTMKKFKKGQKAFVARTIDLRKTGGPLIPEFALATVLIRRRDGRLWVDLKDNGGQRHLYPQDLQH